MFNKSYCLSLTIFSISITNCICYANYGIFNGFGENNSTSPITVSTSSEVEVTKVRSETTTTEKGIHEAQTIVRILINETVANKPSVKLKSFKDKCPEVQEPISFGTYVIPTQRDLVLFTKRTLIKLFNDYHEKTLMLLKDIREASTAAQEFEKNCRGQSKTTYKKCVTRISKRCLSITKDLITILEDQRRSVNAVIKDSTCTMKDMKTDPIQLIKTISVDEATIEFALPAFLRLIGECAAHCSKEVNSNQTNPRRHPSRHMTDQQLVVKHLLTQKNYIQLIKDSEVNA